MRMSMKAVSFSLLVILCLFQLGWAFRLPDTGQQTCYNNKGEEIVCPEPGEPFYGQDAQYKGPEPAYQDNGDGTVTDLNTGLIWQKSSADVDEDGEITLRDCLDWQDACDFCNERTISGHSDFRLPNRRELLSIVDYGKDSFPTINSIFDCRFTSYWSGSAYAVSAPEEYAWYVHFKFGVSELLKKRTGAFVRCVRGKSIPSSIFKDNPDGTVTDNVTGLVWQKSGDHQELTWQDAMCYCENLELGEYTDWRLPNIRELESLVDWERYLPAINPVFDCQAVPYRSGTITFFNDRPGLLVVNFRYGEVYDYGGIGNVRCVRGRQTKTDHNKAIPSIILLLND